MWREREEVTVCVRKERRVAMSYRWQLRVAMVLVVAEPRRPRVP